MTDTAVGSQRESIQVILQSIDGVKTVAHYTPPNLSDAHCPIFIIVPARADHEYASFNDYRTVRAWRLVLLVGQVLQGDYGAHSKKLDPFYERVENAFIGAGQLDGLDAQIVDVGILYDEGEQIKEWPPNGGKEWVGCEWVVHVDMMRRVTYDS